MTREGDGRRRRAWAAAVVAAIPDPAWGLDVDGLVLDLNPAATLVSGAPERALGRPLESLFDPSHRDAVRGAIASVRASGDPVQMEARCLVEGEEPRDVRLSIAPITSDGVLEGISAVARDLTERKRSEELLRAVVRASPAGILVVARDGSIRMANPESERLLGYEEGALIGLDVDALVPAPRREGHEALRARYDLAPTRRAMGQGRDLSAVRRDGSEVPIEVGLAPIVVGGEPATLCSIVDISERKRVEGILAEAMSLLERRVSERTEELRRSNQDLEQFAYVASHDLQEPLRMVASYCELLAEEYGARLGEEADTYIEFAVGGARRMQSLLSDLLAYSRVGSKGGRFEEMPADEPLDAALANLKLAVARSGATVTRGALPTVVADRGQLTMLFQNLLSNALRFAKDGPPRIDVRAADGVISVRDEGIGFDMRHAERIFTIFKRLHTQEEYPGTGVGLAICKRIVDRHRGRIWAEAAPGRGATFSFRLGRLTPTAPRADGDEEDDA